jgi:hypothetical protein
MPKPPDKDKPISEWTPAEHFEHKRSGAVPMSGAYRAYYRGTLEGPDLRSRPSSGTAARSPSTSYRWTSTCSG